MDLDKIKKGAGIGWKIIRVIAALLVPGLGHWLKGQFIRGILIFPIFFGLMAATTLGMPVIVPVVFFLLQTVDAYR